MAWLDDYSVDFSTGNIRRTGGATRYPVIDMHRALITLSGQATRSGDDLGDITDLFVPSRRASDTDITLNHPMNLDPTAVQGMFGGSITYGIAGAEKYSGLAIGGTYAENALPQVFQNNVKLTNYWGFSFSPDAALGYAVRILVKSRTAGVDIDGGRVRVQSRGYTHPFREASTVLGSNESVASPGDVSISDVFNSVPLGTISDYTDIVNTEGYHTIDYATDDGASPFYMEWTKGSGSEADVYNRIKYETRDGSTETLYGLNGEFFRGITHQITVDGPTGTLVDGAAITWGTGTGQLLAMDSDTAATQIWIQLLTGVVPTHGDTLTAGGTVDVNVTVDSVALGGESVAGNFTGSWVGSKGAGQAVADVGSSDSFTSLNGRSQSPPNIQSVSVGSMVALEDTIVLGKSLDGITINKAEYAAASGNDLGDSTIMVKQIIENVPIAGYVRIGNGSGGEDSYKYSSFNDATFTLDAVTLSQNYSEDVDVYPLIFDQTVPETSVSQAWSYTSDVLLAGQVVDDGSVNNTPIVSFPLTGSFTSTGFSANIVRQSDI